MKKITSHLTIGNDTLVGYEDGTFVSMENELYEHLKEQTGYVPRVIKHIKKDGRRYKK